MNDWLIDWLIDWIRKFNKGFLFFLCVIDVYSIYAWVVPLKIKKGFTVTENFQEIFQRKYG